jgi:putative metallohydrolase (TIGR04338 family)
MPRDNQKTRLYQAEDAAFFRIHGKTLHQTIPNNELDVFVQSVLKRRAFRSRWPFVRAVVRLGRGGGGAAFHPHKLGDFWTIHLGRNCRNEMVILHEIAHCLISDDYAPHGPEYAGVFLYLVKLVMGDEAYRILLGEFRSRRVKRNNTCILDPVRIRTPRRLAA